MKYLHAFSLAWALCTRVPLPRPCYPRQVSPELQSLSVLFYPLVGLVLGGMLFLLAGLLPGSAGALFTAVSLVCVWVLLTGAMHLDGLADSVDAYCASHKGDAVTLAVFKDPACGPMAVAAIVLVLLLKVAALSVLLERGVLLGPLLSALMISRAMLFPYMAYTRYLREQGLAADTTLGAYRSRWLLASSIVLVMLLFTAAYVVAFVLAAAIVTWCWRRLWIDKIGGYVGDCLGGLVELVEVLILVVAVFLCF